MKPTIEPGDALVLVDLQRDFMPGGALPVPEGDKVIGPANALVAQARRHGIPVVLTRDWHPQGHCSFDSRGGRWPAHCVAGTEGAAFHPGLVVPDDAIVVSKATDPNSEAYSGFQGTELAPRLKDMGVRRLWVGGLATDYCVRATVLDALNAGFEVVVVEDAVAAVDASPGDGKRALDEMRKAGAKVVRLREIA